jgi:hypothetical protein
MTSTLERVTAPALEPEDGKRATVKAWRRELADWLRGHGMAATGEAWELATVGVRDLVELRRAAVAAADGLVRHWSGTLPAGALTAGDTIDGGEVTGDPVTDPETGSVWVTVRRVKSSPTDHDVVSLVESVTDVELEAGTLVAVTRAKGTR